MPVMIKDMGEKGRGLVASKAFTKGDLILRDKTVVDYEAEDIYYDSRTQFEELMTHVDKLPVEERQEYFQLAMNPHEGMRIKKDLFSPAENEIVNAWCIYKTNRIMGGVCLTLSLLNHSCDFNSMWVR